MRRLLLVLWALAATVVIAAPALSAPVMEVPQQAIRLGKPTPQGVPVVGVFQIKNRGDQALEIKKVSAG